MVSSLVFARILEIDLKLNQRPRSAWFIDGISVVVVAVVAILLAMPEKLVLGDWTKVLPHVIGSVNTLTSAVLLCGLFFIKKGRVELHRYAMTTAFLLGVVFLISYITYHISNPSSKFAGTGLIKGFYLATLASHILLSLIVLPLVLRAMFYAVSGDFVRHKRTVKFAFPIWLYVSVTGVIVYALVHQVYVPK